MELYLDSGNSSIKWWVDTEVALFRGSFDYSDISGSLIKVREKYPKIQQIILASVLDRCNQKRIVEALTALFNCPLKQCIVTEKAVDVTCAYDDVEMLGIDRWLAVIAAWNKYKKSCLVVDLGTAATLDVVDKKGVHLGGYIVSGLGLSIKALLEGTDNVRPGSLESSKLRLKVGQNTAEAVYNGALASLVSLINAAYSDVLDKDKQALLLISGGDANLVVSHLEYHHLLVENLVFSGMKLLNRGGAVVDAV